jgi:hypothetical protein
VPTPGSPDTPLDVLEYELVQEQAAALGRMGGALETALDELREFDATHPSADQARRHLVRKAGKALWMFMVQREACGLRDGGTVARDYNVPAEVMLQSGCPQPVTYYRRRHRHIASRVG